MCIVYRSNDVDQVVDTSNELSSTPLRGLSPLDVACAGLCAGFMELEELDEDDIMFADGGAFAPPEKEKKQTQKERKKVPHPAPGSSRPSTAGELCAAPIHSCSTAAA